MLGKWTPIVPHSPAAIATASSVTTTDWMMVSRAGSASRLPSKIAFTDFHTSTILTQSIHLKVVSIVKFLDAAEIRIFRGRRSTDSTPVWRCGRSATRPTSAGRIALKKKPTLAVGEGAHEDVMAPVMTLVLHIIFGAVLGYVFRLLPAAAQDAVDA
jgi:hypothetical protein